jgi:hypothetical protein
VDRGRPPWTLLDFLERLDAWVELERPVDDLQLIVTDWIMTRYDDPYQGMRLVEGFPNLWFGPVPNSEDGRGHVVACTYWIEESRRAVRCDSFATLGLPL